MSEVMIHQLVCKPADEPVVVVISSFDDQVTYRHIHPDVQQITWYNAREGSEAFVLVEFYERDPVTFPCASDGDAATLARDIYANIWGF